MFAGAPDLTNLTDKIHEGQLASILRSTGLSAEDVEDFTSDLMNLIAKSSGSGALSRGMKIGSGIAMAAGLARVVTAIDGYGLMLSGLISDIDNTDGPDILGTVFG